MKKDSSKTDYIQPAVKVVAFKVEGGFAGSPTEDDKAHTDDIQEGDTYEGEGYFEYSF